MTTQFFPEGQANWFQRQMLPNKSFVCGFCGVTVSSVFGYKLGTNPDGGGTQLGGIYICPNCGGPNFFDREGNQRPSASLGSVVQHVPKELNTLYEEARRCTSQLCYTAAVLLCRKMLMNISVDQGATAGESFMDYVTFLAEKGYVPPNGKHWVDHIRKKGNEATHEIALMGQDDAKDLVTFTEMLLRFIYEFPKLVSGETPASA